LVCVAMTYLVMGLPRAAITCLKEVLCGHRHL
jgi:hypothetical protein